jgi:hypothetical protein
MKKMLLAGCSHSVGFGLDDINDSWGNIFARNNGYEIINISKAASSLQYSTQSIINNVFKENYDLVLFQLTTLDRYPIPFNGEEIYLSNDITKGDDLLDGVFHLVPANYLEAIDGVRFPVDVKNIRFFYEKVMYSTFYLNTIFNEIYLIQELLKSKNIKFRMIPYDNYFWGHDSFMNVWRSNIFNKIDKSLYLDYPFMKWLEDNYNPHDYYIDNGFHLNVEGHKLFANQYLAKHLTLE